MALGPVNLSDNPVDELVKRILASRQITRADQERFMSALLSKNSLSDSERVQVDQLFDALRNGRVRVVD
ncbi:hypothetical protein ACQ4M4_06040 [Leptolyngbya sp. AN02str]|uniref:hypothetical protein n=1 Tax=Leptolyngbya sp. AN02str TaxID=3423363 RepID=UPI003D31165E